jgi:ferritin
MLSKIYISAPITTDWSTVVRFKKALEEGKFTVFQLALQYQKEQVEELSKMTQLLDELDTFGTSPEALRLMDNYMLKLSKQ